MSHILIVEDEPAVQAALQDTLTAYRVQSVSTVAEALRYLRQHNVDLLLLDLQLGAKSGMEVAHYVRQHTP